MNPEMPKVTQIAHQRITTMTDVFWQKLAGHGEIVLNMFGQPGAKSLVRTGDGEMYVLAQQHESAPQLAEAIAHADCLGLRGMYTSAETKSIIRSLRLHHNVDIDKSVHVSTWVFCYMPELVGKVARGRRVLWITSGAHVIIENLENPAFRDFYGLHDIAKNDRICAAPPKGQSPFPENISVDQAFEVIKQQLPEKDFDLALVGAGITGKLVCHYIKTSLGKSAIDIGVCMSFFKGSRERVELRAGDRIGMQFLVWDPKSDFVPEK